MIFRINVDLAILLYSATHTFRPTGWIPPSQLGPSWLPSQQQLFLRPPPGPPTHRHTQYPRLYCETVFAFTPVFGVQHVLTWDWYPVASRQVDCRGSREHQQSLCILTPHQLLDEPFISMRKAQLDLHSLVSTNHVNHAWCVI